MAERMKYLLDSNILSYAAKVDRDKPEGVPHWVNRHLRIHQQHCCLPSIAIEEVTFGMMRRNIGKARQARIEGWFRRLPKVAYDEQAARLAGKLRADLARRGLTVEEPDVRIAAIALRYDLTLITNNEKHFANIPKLRVLNWAKKPISTEKFIRVFIYQAIRGLHVHAALLIAFVAYFLAVGPKVLMPSGAWFPAFLLNTVVLAVVVGIVFGFASETLTITCVLISRRRLSRAAR